jgi:primosomal protein DnaI
MESLGNVLKQLDQFNRSQGRLTVEERLARVKKHPAFHGWIAEQGEALGDEQLLRSLSDIVHYVRETEHCQACPGLDNCPNTMQGYQPILNLGERQMIGLQMKKCEKKLAKESQLMRQNLIRSHHIPLDIIEATFQTIERDQGRLDALSSLMEFCLAYRPESMTKGIYLYGPLGVGKSHMMGAAAKKMAERGIASLMVYVPDFFREMKESIGDHTLYEKIHALKTVPVLILDDIGAESLSGWARDEVLGTILQHRVNERLPTLYTSNYDLDGLEEHFAYSHKGGLEVMKAKRLMERIRHYVHVHFVDGPNRRKA